MSAPPLAPPPTAPSPPPAPDAPPARGVAPGRLALGLVLLLLGAGWLAEALGLAQVRWQTALSAIVMAIGGVLLATGRRRGADGLIGLGIFLSVALIFVAALPGVPFSGELGDRDLRVDAVDDLAPSYELAAGTLELDLRDLRLPPGSTEISASVGAGELRVRVPREVTVEVSASVAAGEIDVLGERRDGIGPTLSMTSEGGRSTLVLDLSVALGKIEVTR